MQLTIKQLRAVSKLGVLMAAIDGRVDRSESLLILKELSAFNVSEDEFNYIMDSLDEMETTEAMGIVAGMNEEQKTETCAFLGAMIAQDGQVDDKEMALWSLISQLCGLPRMSIKEALEYMA